MACPTLTCLPACFIQHTRSPLRNVSICERFCNDSLFYYRSSLRAKCITCMPLFRGCCRIDQHRLHLTQRAVSSCERCFKYPELVASPEATGTISPRSCGAHGQAASYYSTAVLGLFRASTGCPSRTFYPCPKWPLRSQIHRPTLSEPTKKMGPRSDSTQIFSLESKASLESYGVRIDA